VQTDQVREPEKRHRGEALGWYLVVDKKVDVVYIDKTGMQ